MTVCESCEELCDGLGPYCRECRHEAEKIDEEYGWMDEDDEPDQPNSSEESK